MTTQPQKKDKLPQNPYNTLSPEYIENLKDLIKRIQIALYNDTPSNIPEYLIKFLKEEKGYSSSGLTYEEQTELSYLRDKVIMYRGLDEYYKLNQQSTAVPPTQGKQNPPTVAEEPLSDEDDMNDFNDELKKNKIEDKINDKTRRNAFYIETPDISDPEQSKIRKIEKNSEINEIIKCRICHNFLFQCFDENGLKQIIESMEELKLKSGNYIFKQEQINDNFYFLYSGKLDCHRKASKDTPDLLIKIILPGETFGDLNLVYPSNSPNTIKASADSILYVLNRSDYIKIKQLQFFKQKEKYFEALKKIELFKEIKEEDIQKLSGSAKESNYQKGDIIYKEGQSGNVLYSVLEGQASSLKIKEEGKPPVNTRNYKQNDYTDELAIVTTVIHNETLVAESDKMKLIAVDMSTIKNELGDPTVVFKLRYEQEQERIKKLKEEYANRIYEERFKKKKKRAQTPVITGHENEEVAKEIDTDEEEEKISSRLPNEGFKSSVGKTKKDGDISDSDESFEAPEGAHDSKGKSNEAAVKEEMKEETNEQAKEIAGESIKKPDPHQFPKGEIEEIGSKNGDSNNFE